MKQEQFFLSITHPDLSDIILGLYLLEDNLQGPRKYQVQALLTRLRRVHQGGR